MPTRNLADPSYEPTDEELKELMSRAFAHVAAEREEAHRKLHASIAAQKRVVLAQTMARWKVLSGK